MRYRVLRADGPAAGRGDRAPRRRQRSPVHDLRDVTDRENDELDRLTSRSPTPAGHGPRRHRRRLPARQRVAGADARTQRARAAGAPGLASGRARGRAVVGQRGAGPRSRARCQAEVELPRDDGRPTYALLNTTPVRDAGGAPQHFVFQVLDMTERHEAQARLAANESKLAEAQQIARLGRGNGRCPPIACRGRTSCAGSTACAWPRRPRATRSPSSACIPTTARASGGSWTRRWPSGGRGASTTGSPAPTARSGWCTPAARSSSTRTTPPTRRSRCTARARTSPRAGGSRTRCAPPSSCSAARSTTPRSAWRSSTSRVAGCA